MLSHARKGRTLVNVVFAVLPSPATHTGTPVGAQIIGARAIILTWLRSTIVLARAVPHVEVEVIFSDHKGGVFTQACANAHLGVVS